MFAPGDVISYNEMCMAEGFSLQRGMNFKVNGGVSIILMSLRKGAPYEDQVEDDGKVLIYEGHDVPKNESKDPKNEDQQEKTSRGLLTQNGKFYAAAQEYAQKKLPPELVKVYEKIKDGIWVFNGVFELVNGWVEKSGSRYVFKFKLVITDGTVLLKEERNSLKLLEHNRVIPTSVKLAVWKIDKGQCRECGSKDNLHFDHILPYSKGGTSLKVENIQLLCARHNLQKSAKII